LKILEPEDGSELINERVKIYWSPDAKYYAGYISEYLPQKGTNGEYLIQYDDGDSSCELFKDIEFLSYNEWLYEFDNKFVKLKENHHWDTHVSTGNIEDLRRVYQGSRSYQNIQRSTPFVSNTKKSLLASYYSDERDSEEIEEESEQEESEKEEEEND